MTRKIKIDSIVDGALQVGDYTLPDTDGTTGQSLTTDGSGGVSWADAAGGGSFEAKDSDTIIGEASATNQYDRDFVIGSPQLDDTGSSANDKRMFFDKGTGAFRVGRASANAWDAGNRGSYSFATGYNTIATGSNSVALGSETKATGTTSFASGYASEASGMGAVALGDGTLASGKYSLAIGEDTESSGEYSFAGGINSVASHFVGPSFAFGDDCEATGQNTIALGGSTAAGKDSVAIGDNNYTNNSYSMAFGLSNTIDVDRGIALGNGNSLTGYQYGIAIGSENVVTTASSYMEHGIAIGSKNEIGFGSASTAVIAMGRQAFGNIQGSLIFSTGQRSKIGDTQSIQIVLAGSNDGSLFMMKDGVYRTTIWMPEDSAWMFDVKLIAYQTGGTAGTVGDTAAVTLQGAISRTGSATPIVSGQTATNVGSSAGAASWTASASTSSTGLVIELSVEADKTVNWTGDIKLVQTLF